VSPSASHSFNPAFPDAQAISPTPSDAGAPRVETAELARLAQCLARVHHECAIVKLEAAPHARPKYRGPLYLLIASLIAGSIGYQLAGFSPTEAAHAALAVVAGTR